MNSRRLIASPEAQDKASYRQNSMLKGGGGDASQYPLLGHKRTFSTFCAMSAMLSKADMNGAARCLAKCRYDGVRRSNLQSHRKIRGYAVFYRGDDPTIRGRATMRRLYYAGVAAAFIASALVARAQQQAPAPAQVPAPSAAATAPPPTATTKVTDNVYIFRYGGHQAMFVVTPAGAIAPSRP